MRAFPLQIALLAIAAILALAAAVSTVAAAEDSAYVPHSLAASQEHGGDGESTTTSAPGEDSGIDVVPVALGTVIGIVIGGVIFSVFYMLKRRVGGFPANPAWVAPITIMPSKDFPDDASYGGGDDHGHGHAPAGH